jgi:hypothetical protein
LWFIYNKFLKGILKVKSRENFPMRISDNRYNRDRLRLDLALRMIRHEARTCTIRTWTGLTDDRIRKLYRAYVQNDRSNPVRRHRGKSPSQVEFFLRNPGTLFEAQTLGSLFALWELLVLARMAPGRQSPGASIERGTLFCAAYETYTTLHRPARISFEHAWFLLGALTRADELRFEGCAGCGGVLLRDRLADRRNTCAQCRDIHLAINLTSRPATRGMQFELWEPIAI